MAVRFYHFQKKNKKKIKQQQQRHNKTNVLSWFVHFSAIFGESYRLYKASQTDTNVPENANTPMNIVKSWLVETDSRTKNYGHAHKWRMERNAPKGAQSSPNEHQTTNSLNGFRFE